METLNRFFQDFVSTSAHKMILEGAMVSRIDHKGLRGSFREYSLARFLQDFLPITFGVGCGSIQDAVGNQSPESDVIIWQRDLLPPALFSTDKGVYPLEACRYWFEVKSVLNSDQVADSLDKARKVASLLPLLNYQPPYLPRVLPVLFAYGSDASSETELDRFLRAEPSFYDSPIYPALCVVGKGYWTFCGNMSSAPPAKKWIFIKADDKHYEVVSFLAGVLNSLQGSKRPSFGYYIMDPDSHGKGIFI